MIQFVELLTTVIQLPPYQHRHPRGCTPPHVDICAQKCDSVASLLLSLLLTKTCTWRGYFQAIDMTVT